MQIVPATSTDLAAVAALLGELALPTDGISDQFPSAFVKVEREGALAGGAALEVYGRAGLLRSVAVRPSLQHTGLGRALVADRIAAAREMKLEGVYLLTTTAADYFPRLGFAACDRQAVPAALASSPEFASVCPASAKCLAFRL
jgi:amino-acid N-acetyltransferase